MVATQMITGSAVASLLATQTGRFTVVDDPQKDAGIKAAVGVGLILASMMVKKNGWAKQVLIGTGTGLTVGTLVFYYGR